MSQKNCVFVKVGEREKHCKICGFVLFSSFPPEQCYRNCHGRVPTGVGTLLKRSIELLLIFPDKTCGCEKLVQQMDQGGPDWCEENASTILDQMEGNARKRGIPFSRWVASGMLSQGIAEARELIAAYNFQVE